MWRRLGRRFRIRIIIFGSLREFSEVDCEDFGLMGLRTRVWGRKPTAEEVADNQKHKDVVIIKEEAVC